MLKKIVSPIIENKEIIGTKIEYRIFGLLIYQKIFHAPIKYGIKIYQLYQTDF